MVGILLNSHPNIAISNEYQWVQKHTSIFIENNLLGKILSNQINKLCAYEVLKDSNEKKGNWFEQRGYKYSSDFKSSEEYYKYKIFVLGDKYGGILEQSLKSKILKRPYLDIFTDCYQKDFKIKFLHVIRNPFDMISTRFLRRISQKDTKLANENIETIYKAKKACLKDNIKTLELVIKESASLFQYMDEIRVSRNMDILDIRYEDFVQNIDSGIRNILTFLEVDCPRGYIEYCSLQTRPARRSIRLIENIWSEEQIRTVNNTIAKHAFLTGYSFE